MGIEFGMVTHETIDELFKELSPSEKILLAQDLWDDVAKHSPESITLSDAQKAELERLGEKYHGNTTDGVTIEELDKKLKSRR